MAARRSYYDILNVTADAEPVVIEASYRALMKRYHPDQAAGPKDEGGGAESGSASDINTAYATLRDPGRRAEYDQRLWSRHQAIMLAQAPPPLPPDPWPRAFGWTGWLVAAALGGILAVMVSERGGIRSLEAIAREARTVTAEPDHRTQPERIAPPDIVIAAEPPPVQVRRAPIRRQAMARRPRPAPRKKTETQEEFLAREGYIY